MRRFYTCTKCGETWESKMSSRPVPCGGVQLGVCKGLQWAEVRPATEEEIEIYERMFVDW